MRNILFKTNNLKQYGEQKSVSAMNLHVKKGRIYGLLGRNGAGKRLKNGSGKSTLAGILLKIWNDFSGTILLDGKSITNFSREILTETIGICFQKPPIFRDTIRNNIALNDPIPVEKYISLLSFYKDLEEMGRTLESELIDTGSVSGGQAQKIGIIRTVCRERSVYIFDEPTSNLDSVSKKEFYDMIEHLKQKSIIILFSHEADAEKNADFIIEL